MQVIERGQGEPVVLIPGLQGRWEYVRPSVEALGSVCRVITFSLCDEPSGKFGYDASKGLDAYADQVEAVLDRLGLERATMCGISFGGLVALRVAARRPQRASRLVLVSTPGADWHLKRRHEWYARLPWIFGPIFLAETPFRLKRELAAVYPHRAERLRFSRQQLSTLLTAPVSVSRMAARARLIGREDRRADSAAVRCPTLVVHGEPSLDHVVDAGQTCDYARLIAGATTAVIERTGHLGSITRPQEFAAIVSRFVRRSGQDSQHSAA